MKKMQSFLRFLGLYSSRSLSLDKKEESQAETLIAIQQNILKFNKILNSYINTPYIFLTKSPKNIEKAKRLRTYINTPPMDQERIVKVINDIIIFNDSCFGAMFKKLKETAECIHCNLDKIFFKKIYELKIEYYTACTEGKNDAKKLLEEIISQCDEYMKMIPDSYKEMSLRQHHRDRWESARWLRAVEVLNTQKWAVRNFYLPQAKTIAKAYFLLLSHFFLGANWGKKSTMGPGKSMNLKFFYEFHYKGNDSLYRWVSQEIGFEPRPKISEEHWYWPGERGLCANPLYLDEKKRLESQVSIRDGKLYFKNTLLDTRDSDSTIHNLLGAVLFSADVDGSLYISDPKDSDVGNEIHHSIYLRGEPALCAGTLEVREGVITKITPYSGHYQPARKHLLSFLNLLRTKGINLSVISVKEYTGDFKNAEKYLNTRGYCLSLFDSSAKISKMAQILYLMAIKQKKIFLALRFFGNQTEQRKQALQVYVDACLEYATEARKASDEKAMCQIYIELIDNARQYCQQEKQQETKQQDNVSVMLKNIDVELEKLRSYTQRDENSDESSPVMIQT